jgi:uncharacterized protein (TIGR03000 family)
VPSPREKDEGKLIGAVDNRARLIVELPADAQLTIDERQTMSTSAMRRFITPPLEPKREYAYTLKGEIVRNGRTITSMKEVSIRAGEVTRVVMDFPAARVASR